MSRAMRTLLTERLRLVPVTPHNAAVLWQVLRQPGLRDALERLKSGPATAAVVAALRRKK